MAIPKFPCRDCGINTCPVSGGREYYEVLDSLWTSAGAPGIGQSDNGLFGFYLCIICLEARMGRRLTDADFKPVPANRPSVWLSKTLNQRLRLRSETTWQFFPNALARAMREKGYDVVVTPTGSCVML